MNALEGACGATQSGGVKEGTFGDLAQPANKGSETLAMLQVAAIGVSSIGGEDTP